MKKFSFFISLFLLFWLLPLVAYAHPGKTDSNGGHWDHSTGEYHFHHGYSAHSHYDADGDGVVDCPYDFNDITDHSSASNSSGSSPGSYSYTYPDAPVYATIPFEKSENENAQPREENLSSEHTKKENGMFTEIVGTVFIFLSSLFVVVPLGCLAISLLFSLCMLVMYPISYLIYRQDFDKRDRLSSVASIVISVCLLLYWVLPDFADYLMESNVNIIVFIFFVLIFFAILAYIIYASNNEKEQILNNKDEILDELRKKNHEYCTTIKDLSSFCESLQKKLNKENEQIEYQQKLNVSKLEIAYKDIDRFRREAQHAKNDRYALTQENAALVCEIQELKQQLHFYETGHTVLRPQIDNLPDDVYFVDGLPIAGNVTKFEPFGRFTVYASRKGTRFHAEINCGGNWLQPIHLFDAIENKQRCMKCGGTLPDSLPEWYIAYKHRK